MLERIGLGGWKPPPRIIFILVPDTFVADLAAEFGFDKVVEVAVHDVLETT